MSLDCYPFDGRYTIGLSEQPMALDVAYSDDLFVSVTDKCGSIVIYDLTKTSDSRSSGTTSNQCPPSNLIGKFSIGHDIVVDQLIYCRTGDYLACVGHKGRILSAYTIFQWRNKGVDKSLSGPEIVKLNINTHDSCAEFKMDKLNSIDCCQRTGNLAISCGDKIMIFKFTDNHSNGLEEDDSHELEDELTGARLAEQFEANPREVGSNNDLLSSRRVSRKQEQHFKHIISIKLTIHALKICLLENYLSITSVDHIQVLKLELLTLQIQADGLDGIDLQIGQNGHHLHNGHGNIIGANDSGNNDDSNNNSSLDPSNFTGAPSEATTATIETNSSARSIMSDSNSTTTDFSSFNNTFGNEQLNSSDMSILTMGQQHQQQMQCDPFDPEITADSNQSADDCITWNLNTKKLVKLPTLMHNTSTNLSSYHICHPLELLGPASESIACRVRASIYSLDFCQNQLEAVVMLCKQFDFDKDPLKCAILQAVYLPSHEDQKRLYRSSAGGVGGSGGGGDNGGQHALADSGCGNGGDSVVGSGLAKLLKSNDYELLASVSCFVSTLTTCFVYSLHGKKVVRTQTITLPDLCLDLRPDLLNVYLLTPLGLQICSTGICDSTFRYDWSSSSDLNLKFLATDRTRCLTTSSFIVLVSSYMNGSCLVECLKKPSLLALYERIVHTVGRCQSISIRSNMLTYLHATAQLASLSLPSRQQHESFTELSSIDAPDFTSQSKELVSRTDSVLKSVTIMLCKQLLQKKQTNVITNSRIDKNIKHLLEISMCDFKELMGRHLKSSRSPTTSAGDSACEDSDQNSCTSTDLNVMIALGDDDQPMDTDYELIKIYLKHAKFSQSLLDYLVANSKDEVFSTRMIDYMFEHNPRLLIKCAQRYPLKADCSCETTGSRDNPDGDDDIDGEIGANLGEPLEFCLRLLVEKLKQLVEFDSTGINRATVLFTLAILYNSLGQEQGCLSTLGQIKPLNHLAITMCSNHELSRSIAGVVHEHYPDVFNLFLTQLAKRDKLAADEFRALHLADSSIGRDGERNFQKQQQQHKSRNYPLAALTELDDEDRGGLWTSKRSPRFSGSLAGSDTAQGVPDLPSENGEGGVAANGHEEEEHEEEHELFERKLKLLSEIPTIDLIELLTSDGDANGNGDGNGNSGDQAATSSSSAIDRETSGAYLKASINLLESQFILARLRENSH